MSPQALHAGVRTGMAIGKTDDDCNIIKGPVHVHDLDIAILRCLHLTNA